MPAIVEAAPKAESTGDLMEWQAMHVDDGRAEVDELKSNVLVTKYPMGILRFVGEAFGGSDNSDEVFARTRVASAPDNERSGLNMGVYGYGTLLSPRNPWVGFYNLDENTIFRACEVSADLAKVYFDNFGEDHSREAIKARSNFARVALGIAPIVLEDELRPGDGVLIAQKYEDSPTIAYEFSSDESEHPSRLLEFAHPVRTSHAVYTLKNNEMMGLDLLITSTLKGE